MFNNKNTSQISGRRMAVMAMLGFSSGLPLALSAGTLQAWMASIDISIATIGLFTLAQLPYVLKFLWAPLMDRYAPSLFDRRRGWIFLSQIMLIVVIALLAGSDPRRQLEIMGLLALLIAFISASQDIAFDAYRAELLPPKERGLGAGISVSAYRIALIVSGAGALIMADHIGWHAALLIISLLFVVGMLGVILGPDVNSKTQAPASLDEAVVQPFIEFLRRDGAVWILVFIVLYKLGDAFAGSLTTAFLIADLQFSLADVGWINKFIGLAMTIVGALAGGALMIRLGLFRALLWFGVLQAFTNFGFTLLAWYGKSYAGAIMVVGLENLAGGMGTAAFVALLMALCNRSYTATQFALLSALASLGRVFAGPPSGFLVETIGWPLFYLTTFAVAVPGLLMLLLLKRRILALEINEE